MTSLGLVFLIRTLAASLTVQFVYDWDGEDLLSFQASLLHGYKYLPSPARLFIATLELCSMHRFSSFFCKHQGIALCSYTVAEMS